MKLTDIELFIFDMDGLIFESEKLYVSMAPKLLSSLGYENCEELTHKSLGLNYASSKKLFTDTLGADFPYEKYFSMVQNELQNHNEKYGLEFVPGVLDFLKFLKEKHLKMSIASSSSREVILSYLKRNNIEHFFNDIVSGKEVKNGKPNPEIFLLAAKNMGANPEKCVVFEDSYNGIRAANKAKMIAVMVPNILPANEEMKELSSFILPNIYDFLEYLD